MQGGRNAGSGVKSPDRAGGEPQDSQGALLTPVPSDNTQVYPPTGMQPLVDASANGYGTAILGGACRGHAGGNPSTPGQNVCVVDALSQVVLGNVRAGLSDESGEAVRQIAQIIWRTTRKQVFSKIDVADAWTLVSSKQYKPDAPRLRLLVAAIVDPITLSLIHI